MRKSTLSTDSPVWKAAVRFHGHACPGLAIGCRMALAAISALRLDVSFLQHADEIFLNSFSPDEELVCVAETDACCVDAVQFLLGCTMGKGNLLLKLRGKTAMSFYHRPTEKSVRILWTAVMRQEMSREQKMDAFLSGPEDRLFVMREIQFNPPHRAVISKSMLCSQCGEMTAEYAIKLLDGKPFCTDCWPVPSRIL